MNVRPFSTVGAFKVPAGGDLGIISQGGSALIAFVIAWAIVWFVVLFVFRAVEFSINMIEDTILDSANPFHRGEDADCSKYKDEGKY